MLILKNEDGQAMTPEDLSEQLLSVLERTVLEIANALPEAEFNGIHPVCPICGEACRDTDSDRYGRKEWSYIDIGQSTERGLEHIEGEDTLTVGEEGPFGASESEADSVLRCPNGHFLRFDSINAEFE
jgi:hypothetical protein